MRCVLLSEKESKKIAEQIAQKLKPSSVVLLKGELGVGKSFFCRQIIRYFCGQQQDVPSPTFNIVHSYDAGDFNIIHYDLYRLGKPSELFEIGFEEMIEGNITLVEWPQILIESGIISPDKCQNINLEIKPNGARSLDTNII